MKTLTTIGALALSVGTIAAAPAFAEKFTFAHGFVPTHSSVTSFAGPWMTCVTEATNGEITFDHFPAGEISGHKESLTSLTNGLADFSMVVSAYEFSKVPLTNMSMLPGFGTTVTQMNGAFREMLENGSPLMAEWNGQGVQPIMNVQTPAYQLLSMSEPAMSLDALNGKLIRSGGGTANLTVAAVGGVAVEMAAPDMFLALQRGTVDSTILAFTSAPAYGLQDILKSISTNGSFGSGQSVLAMNKEKFDALSDPHRAAIVDCGKKAEISGAEESDAANVALAAEFAAKGITMYEFPPELAAEISTRLATVAEDFVSKLEADGQTEARKTYEMYLEALK